MQDLADANTVAKIMSDLWIHQNRRMWDRLQLAATLQAGLLGAAYLLQTFKLTTLLILTCGFAMLATAALIHISSVDRAIRNKYRDELKKLGVHIGFDRDNPEDKKRYDGASFGLAFLDSQFYMNSVFLSLIGLDAVALGVLLYRLGIAAAS